MIHERVPPIERIGSKVNRGLKDKTALVTGGSKVEVLEKQLPSRLPGKAPML